MLAYNDQISYKCYGTEPAQERCLEPAETPKACCCKSKLGNQISRPFVLIYHLVGLPSLSVIILLIHGPGRHACILEGMKRKPAAI